MLNIDKYKKGNILIIYDKNKWSKDISKKTERNTIIALFLSLILSIGISSFIFIKIDADIFHRILLLVFSFIFIFGYLIFQSFDAMYLNKPVDFSLLEWIENIDEIQIYIDKNELILKYYKENRTFAEYINKQWFDEKIGCRNYKIIKNNNGNELVITINLTTTPINICIDGKDCENIFNKKSNNIMNFDKKI